jgi:hypothetical protein
MVAVDGHGAISGEERVQNAQKSAAGVILARFKRAARSSPMLD